MGSIVSINVESPDSPGGFTANHTGRRRPHVAKSSAGSSRGRDPDGAASSDRRPGHGPADPGQPAHPLQHPRRGGHRTADRCDARPSAPSSEFGVGTSTSVRGCRMASTCPRTVAVASPQGRSTAGMRDGWAHNAASSVTDGHGAMSHEVSFAVGPGDPALPLPQCPSCPGRRLISAMSMAGETDRRAGR